MKELSRVIKEQVPYRLLDVDNKSIKNEVAHCNRKLKNSESPRHGNAHSLL